MPKPWAQVESSQQYQSLDPAQKQAAKNQYFDTVIKVNPKFQSLPDDEKSIASAQFFRGAPDPGSNAPEQPKSPISKQQALENKITSRGSAIKDLVNDPSTFNRFIKHPVGTSLRSLAGAAEYYQGVPASIGLDLQQGNFKEILPHLAQLAQGNRPVQFGDNLRQMNVPEPIAATGGLVADIAASPGGTSLLKAGASAVGNVASKGGKLISKVGDGFNSAVDAVKKSKVDYINEDIVPRVTKMYSDAVNNFTPQIQKFAEDVIKAPKEAIDVIKNRGMQQIQQTRQALNDSPDAVIQKVQQGIASKEKAVSDAYEAATSSFSNNGGVIHLVKTKPELGALLKKAGYLDARGKETAMAVNDLVQNSPLKQMLGYYKSLNPNTPQGVTAVNSFQWNIFRNNLSKLGRQDKSLSKEITGILDNLHIDAEKAGLKGISQARKLARSNFQAEEFLTSPIIKEKRLADYYKLTGEEKRTLAKVEQYTGVKFVDELKDLSAGKYLDKLTEYNPAKFAADLKKAVDPAETQAIYKEYKDILGEPQAKKIFNDIVQHRRGQAIKQGAVKALKIGGIAATGGVIADKL